jgi:hypothetical protein
LRVFFDANYSATPANFGRAAGFSTSGSGHPGGPATQAPGAALAGGGRNVLWTIFTILLVLWLLGWGFHIAGSLVHLLLVAAVAIAAVTVLTGRREA